MLFFNTVGPVNINDHYCIDPIKRFNLDEILHYIMQKKYFVLTAPRQTGKTSFLLALAKYLNENNEYKCLYLNVEPVKNVQENLYECIKGIVLEMGSRARDYLDDDFVEKNALEILDKKGPNVAINEVLTLWAKKSEKPIVLCIDELNSLTGERLNSVLSQLRAGYDKRPDLFPHSVILCGVRDTIGNEFNIKAKSFRLGNLSKEDIEELVKMHVANSNLTINRDALDKIWKFTQGQPWIVNAVANEIFFEMVPRKNNIKTITGKDVEEAAENIIQRREIHLEHITEKLREKPVKKIILPMLLGVDLPSDITEHDIRYTEDLGLIRVGNDIEIANDIYKEVIPRSLIYSTQLLIRYNLINYLNNDGSLNIHKMLNVFQIFYRKYAEKLVKLIDYGYAGTHLILQAFLQRIVDGGGTIFRKYGLNREYFTIFIIWPYKRFQQKILIDIKIYENNPRERYKDMIKTRIDQLLDIMDTNELEKAYFAIFNPSFDFPWEYKIFHQVQKKGKYHIDIWGF